METLCERETVLPQIGDDGDDQRVELVARVVGIENGLIHCDGVRVIINGGVQCVFCAFRRRDEEWLLAIWE